MGDIVQGVVGGFESFFGSPVVNSLAEELAFGSEFPGASIVLDAVGISPFDVFGDPGISVFVDPLEAGLAAYTPPLAAPITLNDVIGGVRNVSNVLQQVQQGVGSPIIPPRVFSTVEAAAQGLGTIGNIVTSLTGGRTVSALSTLLGGARAAGTAGLISTATRAGIGAVRGIIDSAGRFFSNSKVLALAKRVGIDAAAAALGVSAVLIAQSIAADTARGRPRRRGITFRDVRTTKRVIRQVQSIACNVGIKKIPRVARCP
jgi:hypothetical protein